MEPVGRLMNSRIMLGSEDKKLKVASMAPSVEPKRLVQTARNGVVLLQELPDGVAILGIFNSLQFFYTIRTSAAGCAEVTLPGCSGCVSMTYRLI